MPVWPILYVLANLTSAPSLLRSLRNRKNYTLLGKILLIMTGICAAIVLLSAGFIYWFTVVPTSNPLLFTVVTSLLGIGVAIAVLPVMCSHLVTSTLDRLHWIMWTQNRHSSVTIQELLELLEEYYIPETFCNHVIRHIREQHILVATRETATLLKEIVSELEIDQETGYKQRKSLNSVQGSEKLMQELFRNKVLKGRDILILYANNQTIDSLNALLEDIDVIEKK